MNTADALALAQEITDLLDDEHACLAEIDYSGAGRVPTFQIIEATTGEVYVEGLTAEEAIEEGLEALALHEDVVANPNDYHVDTLAHHGVEVPADHPQRAEVVPSTCAAEVSPDCTGEGTAYAGRCLPCEFEIAAQEEMMMAQFAEDVHCSY